MQIQLTITQTTPQTQIPVQPPISLITTLYSPEAVIKRETQELLQQLRNSELFKDQYLEELNQWEIEFFNDYPLNLESDEACENASSALCYLLDQIIYKQYNTQTTSSIFDFEDKLREILERLMPNGIEVEAFIEAYREYDEEDNLMCKQIDLIDSIFKNRQIKLYNAAEECSQKMTEDYNSLNLRLQKLVDVKQTAGVEAVAAVEGLSAKINLFYNQLKTQEKAIAVSMAKLQKHQEARNHALQRCEPIIKQGMKK